MCTVCTTCVCTTRVSTTRVCAPCEHHPCVHHLCVHTIRVCTIPVRTTRLPNTAHTPQAHTAVLHTSVPRRHGEAESPTASPPSPAAPLPTRRRHGALHIHRPRGDHRRPSPHPSVATGAARSGSGCAVCVAAPVAPADGGAGRTAASPPPLTRGATAAPSRGGDRGMERRRRPRSQPRGVSRCNFGNRHQKYRPARRDLKAVGARK